MTTNNLHMMLTELARIEHDSAPELERLEAERARLYDQFLAPLDAQIEAVKGRATVLKASIDEVAVAVYQETGEKRPHNLVQIVITSTIDYDAKAALDWCMGNAPACVRTKYELDKNAFKSAVNNATIDYPVTRSERVGVRISAYSHLLEEATQ